MEDREGKSRRHDRPRKRALTLAALVMACVLALGTGCSSFKTPSEDAIATVNGAEITVKDFTVKLRNALNLLGSTSNVKEEEIYNIKSEALEALIEEKIMLIRAEKLGLHVNDEELKKRVEEIKKDYTSENFAQVFGGEKVDYKIWSEELRKRLLLEKLVNQEVNSKIIVSDEEAMAYYQTNRNRYYSEETVHVAQIVVSTKEKADTVVKRLQAGEDFSKIAQEISTGPEASKGGDLGMFTRGVMPEAFDRVVFSLPEGRTSKVVKSPYGFHVFKVLKKEKGRWIEFPEVKEKIKADLAKGKEEQEFRKWLDALKSEAKVRIDEDRLRQVKIDETRAEETAPGQTRPAPGKG
ncbi:MAG TPA: peptidylprolyl isomerase [Syntrophales bacterium]|nr:peptidylprolyl isomerase [Syntrophales bacterium]